MTDQNNISRRNFLTNTAAGAISLTAMSQISRGAFAAGNETIKVGVIGCGRRGSKAAINCLDAAKEIEIVAMGDLFKDKLNHSMAKIKKHAPDRFKVNAQTSFIGFDAYKKVLECDIDMVILACPPGMRPRHLKAAVEAGKHVFMEKPVAVDPVGIRSIIESSGLAKQKNLSIVAGTQRRHQKHYLDIMKRVQDGEIGEIISGSCYWNMGRLWVHDRKPEYSDMEWQCRNWLYFTWLSGDHITEQHVHNIDVCNWAIGSPPKRALGLGGRQVRTGERHGNIFDHFAVEFEYENGVRVTSMCRQMSGTKSRVSERIVGTKGSIHTDGGNGRIIINGKKETFGGSPNPYVQEHIDLIASIKGGKYLNEGKRVAESTLSAIMGRMSTYTGRELNWKWVLNKSKLDLSPAKYEFGDLPVRPVAIPGKTKLV